MKNLFATLLIGTSVVAGTAHANFLSLSESNYPFVENAVSPIQENLIVEQSFQSDSDYPTIRTESTKTRAEVRQELLEYKRSHPNYETESRP